jgi:hypothetical protein
MVGWLEGSVTLPAQRNLNLLRFDTSMFYISEMFFSRKRRFRQERDVCCNFVNLKTHWIKFLGLSLSKMLIGVVCA